MKLATWNLERGGTRAARVGQKATLGQLRADVLVLTEPGPARKSEPGTVTVTSPPERPDADAAEPWVAIVGSGVESVPLERPYGRLAVAARVSVGDRAFVVYGAVLPWRSVKSQAPELVLPGEDSLAVFRRVLLEDV